MKFYSFDEIKSQADCLEIARELGLNPNAQGRCAATWRGGKNPNVAINKDGWFDHKGKSKGSVIDLVALVRFSGCMQQAQQWLGEYLRLIPRHDTAKAKPRKAATRSDHLRAEGYTEVKRYDYADALGNVIHQVIRFEHPEKPKQFVQCAAGGKESLEGIETVLYNLPEITKAKFVILVEGEKDADTLKALGLPATTNAGGAGAWKWSYTAALMGKDVVMLLDNDEAGLKRAYDVGRAIRAEAASVKILTLSKTQKGDVTDWMQNEGGNKEKLLKAIQDAPKLSSREIAELAGKPADKRAESSPINGKKGGRPPAPDINIMAGDFIRDRLTKDGFKMARHYRDVWYRFENGWFDVSYLEMEKTFISYVHKLPKLGCHASVSYARNVLHNAAAFGLCGIPATTEKPCWLSTGEDARQWIAFSNNIAVDVWSYSDQIAKGKKPTGHTRPVTPDLFSSDFVKFPWIEESTEPALFLNYLQRVMPDEGNFKAVKHMLGVLLCDVAKYEAFWQLYGSGSNGKTVLLDIVQSLVGRPNVCRVPLESLAPGTRFQSFPLATAKVNICGELSTDIGRAALAAIEGQFKHAVSGGTIEIERKGIDKTEARCRARFIMAGNSLPTFCDKSDAIWRRLRIIPCTVQIPLEERDPDLAESIIKNELPAIAKWALEGLAEVIKLKRIPDSPAGLEMKAAHRINTDHERQFFLESGYEAGTDQDRINCADLYRVYANWMCANGYRALGAARFKSRVQEIFPTCRHGVMRINGIACTAYSGIGEDICNECNEF